MALYVISYQTEYTGRHRGQPYAVVTAETPQQALHRYFSDKRFVGKVDALQFLSPSEVDGRPLQHVVFTLYGEVCDMWMYADKVTDVNYSRLKTGACP